MEIGLPSLAGQGGIARTGHGKYKYLSIIILRLAKYVNCHANVTINFWHF